MRTMPFESEVIVEMRITQPAEIFGELLKLGIPTEGYQSDLYHDAIWLATHWKDMENHLRGNWCSSWTFWYTLRDMGTHIGQDRYHVTEVPHEVGMRVLRQFRISISGGDTRSHDSYRLRIRELTRKGN